MQYKYVCPEWFGAKNDGRTDCTQAVQKMFDYMSLNNIYVCKFRPCDFERGEFYLISKTINIRKPVKIEGKKSYISSKSIITYGDDPNHKFYQDNGIALNFLGGGLENPKWTDICINIKVHAKPFFFSHLKNAYIHDCYVSTFTGDTTVTKGLYTFWFAFQCDELSNARFKNVHIDQPIAGKKYNSADGIHLSGGCHDIIIENCHGQTGDDFIAMNANENHSGDIYNITIKNCTIGKKQISGSGIRFYGNSKLSHVERHPQLEISNVSISNCNIRTSLSPCIFFTNNPDWIKNDTTSHKLKVCNINIKKCDLEYLSMRRNKFPSIWIGGTECRDVRFDKVMTVDKSGNCAPFLGFEGYNHLYSLLIKSCNQSEEKNIMVVNNDNIVWSSDMEIMHGDERTVVLDKNSSNMFLISNGKAHRRVKK